MEGQEPFDHNVMRLLEHPGFPSERFGGCLEPWKRAPTVPKRPPSQYRGHSQHRPQSQAAGTMQGDQGTEEGRMTSTSRNQVFQLFFQLSALSNESVFSSPQPQNRLN